MLPKPRDPEEGIVLPTWDAEDCTIRPTLILMVAEKPFRGLSNENPYSHIRTFLDLISTVYYEGVSKDALYLRVFPFSLANKGKLCITFYMRILSEHGENLSNPSSLN